MMLKVVNYDDNDDGYLVMKVMIVKEVMTGDVSPVAMFALFCSRAISGSGLEGLGLGWDWDGNLCAG